MNLTICPIPPLNLGYTTSKQRLSQDSRNLFACITNPNQNTQQQTEQSTSTSIPHNLATESRMQALQNAGSTTAQTIVEKKTIKALTSEDYSRQVNCVFCEAIRKVDDINTLPHRTLIQLVVCQPKSNLGFLSLIHINKEHWNIYKETFEKHENSPETLVLALLNNVRNIKGTPHQYMTNAITVEENEEISIIIRIFVKSKARDILASTDPDSNFTFTWLLRHALIRNLNKHLQSLELQKSSIAQLPAPIIPINNSHAMQYATNQEVELDCFSSGTTTNFTIPPTHYTHTLPCSDYETASWLIQASPITEPINSSFNNKMHMHHDRESANNIIQWQDSRPIMPDPSRGRPTQLNLPYSLNSILQDTTTVDNMPTWISSDSDLSCSWENNHTEATHPSLLSLNSDLQSPDHQTLTLACHAALHGEQANTSSQQNTSTTTQAKALKSGLNITALPIASVNLPLYSTDKFSIQEVEKALKKSAFQNYNDPLNNEKFFVYPILELTRRGVLSLKKNSPSCKEKAYGSNILFRVAATNKDTWQKITTLLSQYNLTNINTPYLFSLKVLDLIEYNSTEIEYNYLDNYLEETLNTRLKLLTNTKVQKVKEQLLILMGILTTKLLSDEENTNIENLSDTLYILNKENNLHVLLQKVRMKINSASAIKHSYQHSETSIRMLMEKTYKTTYKQQYKIQVVDTNPAIKLLPKELDGDTYSKLLNELCLNKQSLCSSKEEKLSYVPCIIEQQWLPPQLKKTADCSSSDKEYVLIIVSLNTEDLSTLMGLLSNRIFLLPTKILIHKILQFFSSAWNATTEEVINLNNAIIKERVPPEERKAIHLEWELLIGIKAAVAAYNKFYRENLNPQQLIFNTLTSIKAISSAFVNGSIKVKTLNHNKFWLSSLRTNCSNKSNYKRVSTFINTWDINKIDVRKLTPFSQDTASVRTITEIENDTDDSDSDTPIQATSIHNQHHPKNKQPIKRPAITADHPEGVPVRKIHKVTTNTQLIHLSPTDN